MSSISHNGDSISYTYNPDGIRTSKTVNGTTTKYYVMNGTLLGQTKGSDTIVFLYDEKASKYGFDYNGTKYYYIFNVQGDVIGILNQSGTQIVSYQYDPWGKVLSVDGSEASTIGQLNPIRYRGYYYDTETGFYYLQSRYYDPTVRRFLNPDTLILEDAKIDLISYCKNNPVNYVDPSGNVVFYYGWSVSGSLGYHGEAAIVMAFDSQGGAAPFLMTAEGVGLVNASAGQVIGVIWDADSIEDIESEGSLLGAGGQYEAMGITVDILFDKKVPVVENQSSYFGLQGTGSVGVGIDYSHVANTSTTNLYKSALKTIQKSNPGMYIGPVPTDFSTNRNYPMYKGYDSIYYREHYGWKYPWEHIF